MLSVKKLLPLFLLLMIARNSYAQADTLLTSLPGTKEEFIQSEKYLVNSINWLEITPMNEEKEKRTQQKSLVTAWIINSPTVTIELNSKIMPFTKKNSELLLSFMGGWAKYSLANAYSGDAVPCNLAGLMSVIKVYKMGNGLKKDKEMDKIIEAQENGELENWVKERLAKK